MGLNLKAFLDAFLNVGIAKLFRYTDIYESMNVANSPMHPKAWKYVSLDF